LIAQCNSAFQVRDLTVLGGRAVSYGDHVHRQINQGEVGPRALQPVNRGLAAVGGAVVDHPEHPAGRGVGLAAHDLVDQPSERDDADGGLAAAEQPCLVDVPGCQIR